MLSEREQQVLDDIERHLAESDPRLADRLAHASQRPRWWAWVLAVLGWVITVVAAAVGWWIVSVVLLGPLIAVTFAWLVNETGPGEATLR